MKQFLIATAALSLIGGAALAQTSAAMPDASPGSTQGVQAGVDKTTGMNDANGQAATQGGSPTTTPAPTMTPDASAAAPTPPPADASTTTPASTTATNAPASAPPESYPVCTSQHEDRCVNRSQATRTATNATRTHHIKATTTNTTDQSSTATPGQ